MRILLDESLPRELARELPGHFVRTVVEMGWAGRKNGELLRLASAEFDLLLTADRNLEHQQNLARVGVGIAVLIGRTNRIEDLRPLLPALLAGISNVKPGQLVSFGA
jgi:predicted nuclease of predicted toxin-antitoxin system